jgi:hypothetical protein
MEEWQELAKIREEKILELENEVAVLRDEANTAAIKVSTCPWPFCQCSFMSSLLVTGFTSRSGHRNTSL